MTALYHVTLVDSSGDTAGWLSPRCRLVAAAWEAGRFTRAEADQHAGFARRHIRGAEGCTWRVVAVKRLGVQESMWMGGDWFTSWSPRNGNNNAEGPWCQWVHLARLILADERTATHMPELFMPYDDAVLLYDEHHPQCTQPTEARG